MSLAGALVILASALAPAPALAQHHVAVRVSAGYHHHHYYRPYYYGYGAPYFYGSWYFGYPYPAGAYFYAPYAYYDFGASLRLQVTPRVTEVYVDGYYAGTVDDFDGVFQRLNTEPGDHDVELYLPGHRSIVERIYLQPGKTTSIKHTMQPLGPGEAEPVKPSATAAPAITPVPKRKPAAGGAPPPDRPAGRPPAEEPDTTTPGSGRTVTSGSVSLRVQPGAATILIDGERWEGATGDDRLVVQLSPGRHVIDVQKDGYRQYTTEITIKPGEAATLNISLTRQ